MTQPAKVQEPSMEEILASIRRIIADDEAKPPATDKPAAAAPAPAPTPVKPDKPAPIAVAPKPAVMADVPPSKIPAAAPAAARAPAPAAAPPPPAAPPAAPAVADPNSQDDIDALLSGLDEDTSADEIRPGDDAADDEIEVLELTDDMAVPSALPQQQASFHKVDPQDDLEFSESAASRAINRAPAYDPPSFETAAATAAPPPPPSQPMLSQSTVSAVESAFNTLAHTVLSSNARTLEDLVKEMLRPMLKSWLDDNLPGLVERIVKAEIERVSRGRQ
jgi:uncharacterized protein